ncbi:MAG: ATP phosphoribosyltransferase [Candidatus Micrarchaeia archaeon]
MDETQIRIAIPNKGRLKAPSLEMLEKCQLAVESGEDERRLWAQTADPNVSVVFARSEDIPDIVEAGAADCGISGLDLVRERGCDVDVLQKLGFGKCRIVIAGPKKAGLAALDGKKIATKMPNILAGYCKAKGIRPQIVKLKGATEVSPMLGVSSYICDHVSTGSTLAANSLVEIATVFESEACLIGFKKAPREKREFLESLSTLVEGTVAARGKKYLMMNVNEKNLKRLVQSIPSSKSPTVLPLARKGEYAVHTVVPSRGLAKMISRLEALGARDILVVGINQVIP